MTRGLPILLAATALGAAVFTLWPGLDLTVSALFHDTASGAWMAEAPALAALRGLLWTAGEIAVAVFALLFALALARRGKAEVPARIWGFGLLALALGPGALVNLILKDHWGRARPRMVAEFGGDAAFTPVLQITDQCARNCSFVSGEVAMTATLSMIAWLLLSARLAGRARAAFAFALAALIIGSGFLRIAGGGHFLSDALFAALLAALLTLVLWRLTGAARVASRLTGRAVLSDLRAPFAAFRN